MTTATRSGNQPEKEHGMSNMKSWFWVVAVSIIAAQSSGIAQRASSYQGFAEIGQMACLSWSPGPSYGPGFTQEEWWKQAPAHAWVYGYLAGAGYVPSMGNVERMKRVDMRLVDAWMDSYCNQHRGETVEDAL